MKPEELASAIKRLTEWAEQQAPRPESAVRRRLREHLGGDPAERPIVSRALAGWDRPNFQVAVDAWCAGREVEVVGLPLMQGYRAGLAELVRGPEWLDSVELGAVEHVAIALGEHESVTCVQSGFWLVSDPDGPVVVSLRSEDRGMGESLALEIMAQDQARAECVVAEIWALMRERNVYRGRVLELRSRHFTAMTARRSPSARCRRCRASASCCCRACSSGSSARRSESPTMPSGSAQAAGTCAAGCSSTGRPARARP